VPDLVAAVRSALRAAADPSRAPGQQAYMKSALPFLGVRVPEVRRVVRGVVRELGVSEAGPLVAAASTLWDQATHREERYAATALLGLPGVRGDLALAPLYEHMARTGAWWDHVDELAHRVGELHDAHPEPTAALVRAWSVDELLWVRRLAILGQLGRKERTDVDLLAEVIEPNVADQELFIRKAIGWALREAAYVDPGWVRSFVDAHDLSPLSRREALKRIGEVAPVPVVE
jgi:3-methyladenine DNA glycosylase AlkD